MNPLLEKTLSDSGAAPADFREAMERYPYFLYPVVEALGAETDPQRRRALKMRIAASVGSVDALACVLGEDPDEFLHFYPDEEKPALSTEDTICSFIDRFGNAEAAAEAPLASEMASGEEEVPVVPVAPPSVYDISAIEPAENVSAPAEADATSSLLDSFLGSHPAPAPARQAATPKGNRQNDAEAAEDTPLSESLARIMIKNHNYGKALEIITALSLNNPEKSIYFADQIRFLRKLIINESKSR